MLSESFFLHSHDDSVPDDSAFESSELDECCSDLVRALARSVDACHRMETVAIQAVDGWNESNNEVERLSAALLRVRQRIFDVRVSLRDAHRRERASDAVFWKLIAFGVAGAFVALVSGIYYGSNM